MGFCKGIRFTRSLQWQWKWIHNGCIDNDNNDRRCNCHNERVARQCQRATIPKLMVDTTSSATFVLAIKYKFHTLPIYKGNLKDQQQGWCKMYEKGCFPTPVGLQCKIWQDKVYWRGCEASIPVSCSLFAPLLLTVARAPSYGLPNPWGQSATPPTLSQSGFTE